MKDQHPPPPPEPVTRTKYAGADLNPDPRTPSAKGAIHRAGPVIDNQQHCTHCGLLLGDQRIAGVDMPSGSHRDAQTIIYPVGALVEVTPKFTAMILGFRKPDCEKPHP